MSEHHHPRTSTMNSSTWGHMPSLVSSFDMGGRGSPSKPLYRTTRSGTNSGPGVISKPNTPSPTHSPGPGSPLYHHQHNNLNFMHMQQHPSQQYKAPGSRNGVQYNFAPDAYSQGNSAAAGPAGWGAAEQRQSLYQGVSKDVNTELMYKQLQAAEQSRQSNTPHYYSRMFAVQARSQTKAFSDPASPSKSTVNGMHRKDGPPLQPEDMAMAGRTRPGDIVAEKQAWTTLDFSGAGISHLNREVWRFTFLTCIYLNNNRLTALPKELGLLRGLTRLDVSSNQLTSIPPEIGMLTNLKEFLLFDNDIQTLPNEIGTLYQLELLGLEGNPLAEPYKSVFLKEGTQGLISHLLETKPISRGPMERDWKQIQEPPATNPESNLFSILCYNVLCERYATHYMYGYTPKYALAWEHRKKLILNELLTYNPDIACLQEINADSYKEFMDGALGAVGEDGRGGYSGVFYPKTRAALMGSDEGSKVDGCATFYKTDRFELLEKKLIAFSPSALKREDFKKTEDVFNRVMNRDNIAVACFLRHKQDNYRVIVANAHIHWDPAYSDVKLIQVAMLMEELENLATTWSKRKDDKSTPTDPMKIPIVVCGDYNSIQESGVYEYMSRGTISSTHPDFQSHRYGKFTEVGMSHPFGLRSAYAQGPGGKEFLPFTNYTPGFQGVIDYIWYGTSTLSVEAVMEQPEAAYTEKVVGFPDPHFPSDHIVIAAKLRLKDSAVGDKKKISAID